MERSQDLATLLNAAFRAGESWASSLRVGDEFMGASPEAQRRYADVRERAMFVHGAYDVLEQRGVRTEWDSARIVGFKRY